MLQTQITGFQLKKDRAAIKKRWISFDKSSASIEKRRVAIEKGSASIAKKEGFNWKKQGWQLKTNWAV